MSKIPGYGNSLWPEMSWNIRLAMWVKWRASPLPRHWPHLSERLWWWASTAVDGWYERRCEERGVHE